MPEGPAIHEPSRLRFQRMALFGLAIICGSLSAVAAVTHNIVSIVIFGASGVAMLLARHLVARRPETTRWVAHAAAALIFLVATGLATFNGGGLSAPALYALPTIPMTMAFVAGRRAAYLWATLTVIPPVLLALLDGYLPGAAIDGVALKAMRLCGPLGATASVVVAAIAYEDSVLQSNRALREAQAVTEAARAAAEQASFAKSGYLANLSHELRTPLGAVVGLADLIHQQPQGPDVARQAELLQASARALMGLIDDVLDLSRIEAGGLELEAKPVALQALCAEVVESMRHRAEAKGLELRLEAEVEGPVLADPLRVRQVASNLIANAIKFTAAGRVHVHVHVSAVEDDGLRAVQLTVADTGPGVSEDQKLFIFQRFRQATEGTARQFGGSGLGLAIVKELVDRMNGELSLHSQIGMGASFAVRLRCPPATLPEVEPAAAPAPRRTRVLLVEDDRVNREVLRALLKRLDCEVTTAEDGADALAQLAAAPPDARPQLILMDCQMPVMDGLQATRRLRAAGDRTPIIALTASALIDDQEACIAAGMDQVLTKPTTLRALSAVLGRSTPAPRVENCPLGVA